MSEIDKFGLPRDLGDGLVLRWATPDDAEALARFNLAMHSDNPDEPETGLYYWVLDLMRGDHPTTKAGDFTVVVDTNAGGRIVSSLNLISQTWAYDGIPFAVGRPELVATLPEYRRRGLVRIQMDVIHALSADRGELVTAITGIPWYYRQFGYDMALNLGGGREFFWGRKGNSKLTDESYRLRLATVADIPLLSELYQAHLDQDMVVRLRGETNWRHEMFIAHPQAFGSVQQQLIETLDGRVVAYANWKPLNTVFGVREFGVLPGHSWRAAGLFVAHHLEREAAVLNESRPAAKKLNGVEFNLGEKHPLYEALDPEWENGRLSEVEETYPQQDIEDADALFPNLTFLQLLFSYRSIDDLTLSYTDLYTEDNDALVLLRALFPRRSSRPLPME